jgi:branched-chain amino acid transport system ATP-binding protein
VTVLLAAESIEASYQRLQVLRGASVSVEAGRVALLVGRNGSGKSTLLKAIFGMVQVQSGRVLLNDEDITLLRPDQRVTRRLSYVPQTSNLGRAIFQDLTVAENLELGSYRAHSDQDKEMNRRDVLRLFPVLQARQHDKGGALSGGQQQMLAMGIALMAAPRALLLDEPTSGLAAVAAKQLTAKIREVVDELQLGVLLVEQNVRLALDIADRVFVCRAGRVIRECSPQELLESTNLIEVL